MRGVGVKVLRGFWTVNERSSAFTRQGSLVQSQSRPPFILLVSGGYGSQSRLSPLETLTWHTLGTVQVEFTNFVPCLIFKKLILSTIIEQAGIAQW